MAKYKYVNALLEKNVDKSSRSTIRLSVIDYTTKDGSRDREVVVFKKRSPQQRIVTKIRKVSYNNLDLKGVYVSTTEGVEIVEEKLVARGTAVTEPLLVDSITRDITLNYDVVKLQKKALRKKAREARDSDDQPTY